jgi:shikimate dehydrogenase
MIDGQTQLVGLLGWPAAHSLSPAMHNAAFRTLGLNWCYVPLPVPPGQVAAAVRGLGALGFRGANVTVPHKEAVLAHLDERATAARAIGAVNTIVLREGRKVGHNTDADGLRRALTKAGIALAGRRALIAGVGGAARAATYALLQAGGREVVVLGRSPERAEVLVSDWAGRASGSGRLSASPFTPDALVEGVRSADLLINATPVGMWPATDDSIWPADVPLPAHLLVFDLVYNPSETRLLRQARQSGARALGGLEMLVQQGGLAFELWTGERAPLAVMRKAAAEALVRREP